MAYRQLAYHYDRLMDDMPYEEWVRFAEACWNRFGVPKHVVDLGCGTGNIAIPLVQKGWRVTGIDLSADMLAVAQAKLEDWRRTSSIGAGGSAAWVQQDMREWELPAPVDAVISFCDCFNYLLEEDDVLQAFRRVSDGLKPGGVFIFDVHTSLQFRNYAGSQPHVLNEDDIAYIWTCQLDEERSEIEHALTIFVKEEESKHAEEAILAEGGLNGEGRGKYRRIEEMHIQRAYSLDWLRSALVQTGFTRIESYADFRFHPPAPDTLRAFFVALK
jgi:SAM-dependent methyltransferase